MTNKEALNKRNCSVCGVEFDSEDNLVSCPKHSFGERDDQRPSK